MPQIKSMPFPGESPTVSLALAAGKRFGLAPEGESKPAPMQRAKPRSAKRPSRRAPRSGTAKKGRARER